jgi:hypothetical protein
VAERIAAQCRGLAGLDRRRIERLGPDCDPREVEALMRLDLGTLARLCPERFRYEARRAAAVVRADPVLAERTARSLGL